MIWIDLDNSPHVPLFRPIISAFAKRNIKVFVTARDFAQTRELLQLWKIQHILVGAHGGKGNARKIVNLVRRSSNLERVCRDYKIDAAVSHGSRTQVVAANWRGIPSIVMLDYEYTETRIFNYLSKYLLIPSIIPEERLRKAGISMKKVVRYNGFKEEMYLSEFKPDPAFRNSLGIPHNSILVTVRPPSLTSNYHNPRSEKLFVESIAYFTSFDNVYCLLVNRTPKELSIIPEDILKNKDNFRVLEYSVDGLQLLWNSDIFMSGGGTMNREAALLGVPAYSIFAGKRPYIDEYLSDSGKLHWVERTIDIHNIPVKKRTIKDVYYNNNDKIVPMVTDLILSCIKTE